MTTEVTGTDEILGGVYRTEEGKGPENGPVLKPWFPAGEEWQQLRSSSSSLVRNWGKSLRRETWDFRRTEGGSLHRRINLASFSKGFLGSVILYNMPLSLSLNLSKLF